MGSGCASGREVDITAQKPPGPKTAAPQLPSPPQQAWTTPVPSQQAWTAPVPRQDPVVRALKPVADKQESDETGTSVDSEIIELLQAKGIIADAELITMLQAKQAPRLASLGIIRLDYDYPAAPGDIDHPGSFAYNVFYRAVPGLTFEMCQQGVMPEDVKAEFLDAVKFLIHVKGVSAITGDCGFMMYFQKLARTITHKPVFMSALVSLPAVTCAYAHDELIGIFTANGKSLEPMHDLIKDECGVDTHEHRYIIVGCEDIPGFEAVALGTKVDYDKVEPGVVKRALETQAAHPTMRAILFECTELPQFSDAVRHATGLPVYDAITTCNLFMEGLRDNERFGKNNWHAKWDGEQEEYKFCAELTKEQQAKLVNKPAASTFFTPVEAIGA